MATTSRNYDRSSSLVITITVSAVTSFLLGSVLSYMYLTLSSSIRQHDGVDFDNYYDGDQNDDENEKEKENDFDDDDKKANHTLYDTPELDLRLIRKAEAVIQKRTDKVIIVIERCTNDHNYSAILRTAEALGIQTVCLIDPPVPTTINEVDGTITYHHHHHHNDHYDDNNDQNDTSGNENNDHTTAHTLAAATTTTETTTETKGTSSSSATFQPKVIKLSEYERKIYSDHRKFAQNATEWLTIREFTTTKECIETLRNQEGYSIWVTDLSQVAIPLTKIDLQRQQQQRQQQPNSNCWPLPQKMAIVMGTEAVGCSVEMLDNADVRCYLPLYGFADSLNLSVATALVVQQIFYLHPTYIGNMSLSNRHELRKMWFPKLAQQRLLSARQKKQHRAIQKQITVCQQLQLRYDAGESLTSEQISKMNLLQHHEQRLQDIERNGQYHMATNIVQDLIEHPPQPLSDLRRADIHRVTFVGKNVKKKHEHHWKDMVAISKQPLPKLTTASFFRNRLSKKEQE